MQYEFWDYSNHEIEELKNINITTVQTGELIYELKKEDLSEHKNILKILQLLKKKKIN